MKAYAGLLPQVSKLCIMIKAKFANPDQANGLTGIHRAYQGKGPAAAREAAECERPVLGSRSWMRSFQEAELAVFARDCEYSGSCTA